MAAFFEYLRNITYYLLFSALIGMAAPSGKYKKYVSLITGLVLLLLMIRPLKNFAGEGAPVTEWFASGGETVAALGSAPTPVFAAEEPPQAETEYERWSFEQISAAFEDQLYKQAESLLLKEGYVLEAAAFEYEEDFTRINGMDLTVRVSPKGVKKEGRPLIRIEPVEIGRALEPGTGPEAGPEDENAARVKKIFTDFYAPDAPHINVTVNGYEG